MRHPVWASSRRWPLLPPRWRPPRFLADDAPKKVAVSLVFITEANIATLTLAVEPFAAWTKPLIQAVESRFKDEARKRTVVVQVTLHPDAPAEVAVAGDIALSDADSEALLKAADPAKAPRSKHADCTFRIVAKINGGAATDVVPLIPRLETPDETKAAAFRAASTPKRLALMRKWARTEALPILAAKAARADPKFAGVVNLGKSIAGGDPERVLDVAALTDHSSDYWRATMEMNPGIPLVPAIRVALLAANGEIDQARKIAEIARFTDGNKSGPSRVLGDFRSMMEVFTEGVEGRIAEGIALHDKGKLDEAAKVYDSVLKDYPRSAWAHFERFQTLQVASLKGKADAGDADAAWPKAREAILDANLLVPHAPQEQRGARRSPS